MDFNPPPPAVEVVISATDLGVRNLGNIDCNGAVKLGLRERIQKAVAVRFSEAPISSSALRPQRVKITILTGFSSYTTFENGVRELNDPAPFADLGSRIFAGVGIEVETRSVWMHQKEKVDHFEVAPAPIVFDRPRGENECRVDQLIGAYRASLLAKAIAAWVVDGGGAQSSPLGHKGPPEQYYNPTGVQHPTEEMMLTAEAN